jgi:hypothetical protein
MFKKQTNSNEQTKCKKRMILKKVILILSRMTYNVQL